MARVSRIHHFITLQYLYAHVTLTARPEAAPASRTRRHSPLLAALATLQKPSTAACVQHLHLRGQLGTAAHAAAHWRAGSWSDFEGTFALTLAGVLAGMPQLGEFTWELADTYPHPFLYVALSRHPGLHTVTLRFPAPPELPPGVEPQAMRPPLTTLPLFANVRDVRLLGLGAPPWSDDAVAAVVGARSPRSLTCTWRPETVLAQQEFARQTRARIAAWPPLTLMVLELRLGGLFMTEPAMFDESFDTTRLERLEFHACSVEPDSWRSLFLRALPAGSQASASSPSTLRASRASSCSGSHSGGPTPTATCATDSQAPLRLRHFRTDNTLSHHIAVVEACSMLVNLFFVDPTPVSSRDLKSRMLKAVARSGRTLRRLRLSSSWLMTKVEASSLIRVCPGLRELGIAMDHSEWEVLHFLVPFLADIRALLLLESPYATGHPPWHGIADADAVIDNAEVREMLRAFGEEELWSIRYLGLNIGDARNVVWKVYPHREWDGEAWIRPAMEIPFEDAMDEVQLFGCARSL